MSLLCEKIEETQGFIQKHLDFKPDIAVILGSGMGAVAENIPNACVIPYSAIPNLRNTTIQTHRGNMIVAEVDGKKIVFFQGRTHIYEGHDFFDVAFFPLVVCLTGAKILITTSLVGGISEDLERGDLVLITDHLNLSGYNPLIPLAGVETGPCFVDMYNCYSLKLRKLAKDAGDRAGIPLTERRLAFLSGPNFETKMELAFLKGVGADVVGWSMVPEVLVARSRGLEVLGISCVSDISDPGRFGPVKIDDIFRQGANKAHVLKKLLGVLLSLIPDE